MLNFFPIWNLQTYKELTDLAEKGNPYNVHYGPKDAASETIGDAQSEEEGGLYAKINDMDANSYLFCFGRAQGKTLGKYMKKK